MTKQTANIIKNEDYITPRPIRVLWCENTTESRQEDFRWLIKGGLEVILQNGKTGRLDSLESECAKCTLPQEIINLICDLPLKELKTKLTKEQISILNKYIDAIYIPENIHLVFKLHRAGYLGTIINRYYSVTIYEKYNSTNNILNISGYITRCSNIINSTSFVMTTNYAQTINIPRTDYIPYLSLNTNLLSKYKWNHLDSIAELVTVLPLLDSRTTFIQHFAHLPYKILDAKDANESFYNTVCKSRLYVETGSNPYHEYLTALEIINIGVPVIFYHQSGLATAAMTKFTVTELYQMGMCATWDEAVTIAAKCLQDVNFARQISGAQRSLLQLNSEKDILEAIKSAKLRIIQIADQEFKKTAIIRLIHKLQRTLLLCARFVFPVSLYRIKIWPQRARMIFRLNRRLGKLNYTQLHSVLAYIKTLRYSEI